MPILSPEGKGESLVEPNNLRKLPKLILFDLPQETTSWPPFKTERIWGVGLGKLKFQLQNVPFFAKSVAFGDVIQATADHVRREFVFSEVIEKSGHSSLQLIVLDLLEREATIALLEDMGCYTEGSALGNHIAVDVPPAVNYKLVKVNLLKLYNSNQINFTELCLSDIHRLNDIS